MISSLLVYAIVQVFDVFAYHFIWKKTEKACGDRSRFLWLRNNLATLLSQLLNAVLYNVLAFWGVYPTKTIISIITAGFVISLVTSIADTPIIYIARRMSKKSEIQ